MDLDHIDVQKRLEGVNYPASEEESTSTAESNNALELGERLLCVY